MSIPESHNAPWTRKHDKPGAPWIAQAPTIAYPQSLQDLIAVVQSRQPGQYFKAAGSHWALSTAAISDNVFIETNDPNNVFPALGRTLYDVVPNCLTDAFIQAVASGSIGFVGAAVPIFSTAPTQPPPPPYYYVHAEAGKRIYQLYAEMDSGDTHEARSLNALLKSKFNKSIYTHGYGFATMGGAGGQTIVGALTTGTHGGDFDRGPVADCVMAMHIVGDGGKHYWIERVLNEGPQMTDDGLLTALYGADAYGGNANFEIIRDNGVLEAAMVQVGRFGAVYSVVLQVATQYELYQELKYDQWENVRGKIADFTSDLFVKPHSSAATPQQFLQIVVNPPAITDGSAHLCAITRRWTVAVANRPEGRTERVGHIVQAFDPRLNAPRYSHAGNTAGYVPDGDYDADGNAAFNTLDAACASGDFVTGIIEAVVTEIETFAVTHALADAGILAAAAAIGGAGLEALLPELLALLPILAKLLDFLAGLFGSSGSRLGQVLNDVRGALLGPSATRGAGVFLWRAIGTAVFKSEQPEKNFAALSYAIMDTHTYTDVSCQVNVQSVEVFFDATDPNLIAFVDRLLQFENDQEWQRGHAVVGYISLRFCGQTTATIGPAQFARTVAVECSGLADVNGSTQFVAYAVALALDPNIKGILHWGQRNDSTQPQIEFRFGDAPGTPSGPLFAWRGVLSRLTDNGRLDGFSSQFTRQTGLEIVQPVIAQFIVDPSAPAPPQSSSWSLLWNCTDNPPATTLALAVLEDNGKPAQFPGLPLAGSHMVQANAADSVYTFVLTASLATNGGTRTATQTIVVYDNQQLTITWFRADQSEGTLGGGSWLIDWNCTLCPPATTVALDLLAANGVPAQHYSGLPLQGTQWIYADGSGEFTIVLTVSLAANGVTRSATQNLEVYAIPVVR